MELSLVSMLPIAASIVQAVLNGAEFVSHATAANAATIVGNVNGSWTLLARLGDVRNDRVALERDISRRLEQKTSMLRQGLRDRGYESSMLAGAATEVEKLIVELGNDPEYFVNAVRDPGSFYESFRPQIENRKRYVDRGAEGFYEQLAFVAVEEFQRLAPSSPQFQLGALLRIITDLDKVRDAMVATSTSIDRLIEQKVVAGRGLSETNFSSLRKRETVSIGVTPTTPRCKVKRREYESLVPEPAHTYALLGPSGVGKSQIAYTWMTLSGATLKVWIDAKSEVSILRSYQEAYIALCEDVGLKDGNVRKVAHLFLNWLSQTEVRWILVFDSVPRDAGRELRALIPEPTTSGVVVVTSQDRNFGKNEQVNRVEVRGLRPKEGVELMRLHSSELTKGVDEELLCCLGNVFSWSPLALQHVMAGIAIRNVRIEKYLEALFASETPVHDFLSDSDIFSRASVLRSALEVNIADIENEVWGTLASNVLKLLSLTGQTPLPVQWIVSLMRRCGSVSSQNSARFEVDLRSAISILDSRFLVDFDRSQDIVRCHECVRRVTRERWRKSSGWAVSLVDYLDGVRSLWDSAARLTSGALWTLAKMTSSLLDYLPLDPVIVTTNGAASISLALSALMYESGLVAESVGVLDRVIVLYSAFVSPESACLLRIKSRRAKYYSDLYPERAVSEFDLIVSAQLEAQGIMCRDTLESLVDRELACVFSGGAEGERSFLKLLYSICVSALGVDDGLTLKCLGVIVRSHSDSHNYVSALRHCRRLLRARRSVLGRCHRDTLDAAHNYAYILGEMGEYREAIQQYEELLPLQVEVLGIGAPSVLLNRNNVAHYYGLLGQPELAVVLLSALVEDAVIHLGEENRDTFKFRHNLAHWSGHVFGADEAVDMFSVLVRERSRVFGQLDVDVLRTRNRHAFWVARSGDIAFARRLFVELQYDERRVLGTSHWQYRSTCSDVEALGLA